jgi:hypothetical protein
MATHRDYAAAAMPPAAARTQLIDFDNFPEISTSAAVKFGRADDSFGLGLATPATTQSDRVEAQLGLDRIGFGVRDCGPEGTEAPV